MTLMAMRIQTPTRILTNMVTLITLMDPVALMTLVILIILMILMVNLIILMTLMVTTRTYCRPTAAAQRPRSPHLGLTSYLIVSPPSRPPSRPRPTDSSSSGYPPPGLTPGQTGHRTRFPPPGLRFLLMNQI